jgi:hypothetical protein
VIVSGAAAPSSVTSPAAAKAPKQTSPIMPVVYVICGIFFLVAYSLFWVKILNFQLPFPLPF